MPAAYRKRLPVVMPSFSYNDLFPFTLSTIKSVLNIVQSCAFHPLVASETTSLNITGAKVVDGRWADDARVMSTMPAAG